MYLGDINQAVSTPPAGLTCFGPHSFVVWVVRHITQKKRNDPAPWYRSRWVDEVFLFKDSKLVV